MLRSLTFASIIAAVSAGTTQAGLDWLKENGQKEGVKTLASGLQYKVIEEAPAGAKSPLAATPCECHYRGTLIDGTEFDSSYKRGKPTTFAPNQVVKGWTEAMQLMGEGDKWELYIPSNLAYGERNRGSFIKAGDALIFTLELMEVKGPHKEL